jgi:lysophospholipase L1-like esterase
MKRILCYGDSNTWGFIPLTAERYPQDIRWAGVLQKTLGTDYQVIEEGLNGRTTVWNDPHSDGRNGRDYLLPCLETHMPLNLVILMLGTNDVKQKFSATATDIAEGAGFLGRLILLSKAGIQYQPPKLLLVAPAVILEQTAYGEAFDGGAEKSRKFALAYKRVANELGCHFLDASAHIQSSKLDGIHLEAEEHSKLGLVMAAEVRKALS